MINIQSISLLGLFFLTAFSFIVGTLLSNVFGLFLSIMVVCRRPKILIGVLIFIVFIAFNSLIRGQANEEVFKAVILYLRGVGLAAAVFIIVDNLGERGVMILVSASKVIVLILFFSYCADIFNLPSIFDLIPESLRTRQYSGSVGLYNNPNYWAVFLLLLIYLIMLGENEKNKLFFISVLMVMLILTGSRMGFLAGSFLFFLKLRIRKKYFITIIILFVFLFSSFTFLNVDIEASQVVKMYDRFARLAENFKQEERYVRLGSYADYLSSNLPILFFGGGVGQYIEDLPPHNMVVTLVKDVGLVGISLSFLCFFVCFYKGKIRIDICLSLVLLILLVSNDFIDSRAFWFLSGLFIRKKQVVV